jgi:Uma2 family endonuclease
MVAPVQNIPDTWPRTETLADLMSRVAEVPPERVRMRPYPGTATESDLIRANESKSGSLCELVDAVLVEKPMGFYESRLAFVFITFLDAFLSDHDLGIGLAPDAMIRTKPGQVRLPDVCFYSWKHFPGRLLPKGSILNAVPDFAVEILSPTNTAKEMERKRKEYFEGGAKLVWELDPERRPVRVYKSAEDFAEVDENETLDGGTVLPGFTLPVRAWFDKAGRRAEDG